MEACVRGFSYVPQTRLESASLDLVEPDSLDRVWRSSRRQRLREQEDKIWQDFVKESDVVSKVCQDDPYQFLDDVPDDTVKQLFEKELEIFSSDSVLNESANEEEAKASSVEGEPVVEAPPLTERRSSGNMPSVRFADDKQGTADCDMFHIFDDSGQEDALNEETCESPCTVRENLTDPESAASERGSSLNADPTPTTSTKTKHNKSKGENVLSMIESNIYCSKVKDLRTKLSDELNDFIDTVVRNVLPIDKSELKKRQKRATELYTRFNRVHMYQLQRQVADVKRHAAAPTPCLHTEFLAQLNRAGSLHQNALHALQVLHKSFAACAATRRSAELLAAFSQLLSGADRTCRAVPAPADMPAASKLFQDELVETLANLEKVSKTYTSKFMKPAREVSDTDSKPQSQKNTPRTRKLKKRISKRSQPPVANNMLSMYGFDPLQVKGRDPNCVSSMVQRLYASSASAGELTKGKEEHKKSPNRRRRPLMRDPHSGRAAKGKPPPDDAEIHTMVEIVDTNRSDYSKCESTERYDNKKSPRSPMLTPRDVYLDLSTMRNLTPRKLLAKFKPGDKRPGGKPDSARRRNNDRAVRDGSAPHTSRDKDTASAEQAPGVSGDKERAEQGESEGKDKEGEDGVEGKKTEVAAAAAAVVEEKKEECEVSRLLKSLCGTDGNAGSAKNAQLLCMTSTKQPSTPQLLRILEETILKKAPKQQFGKKQLTQQQKDRLRMPLNVSEEMARGFFEYRTRFVQHMLASPLYANSAVGKPWAVIGSVADAIIDGLLLKCAKEMEIEEFISELYHTETETQFNGNMDYEQLK